eukprot:scaffold713_cov131-Cylindrotheca_fusiformis.AAC.22
MASCWVILQQVVPFQRRSVVHRLCRHMGWPTSSSSSRRNSRLFSSSLATPTITISSDSSSFFTHALVQDDSENDDEGGLTLVEVVHRSVGTLVVQNEANEDNNDIAVPKQEQRLTPHQLLALGSIWYMPAADMEHNNKNKQREDPHSLIYKPQRLSLSNRSMVLQKGDYLRIHHTPRRFTAVYDQDWSSHQDSLKNSSAVSELQSPPRHKIIVHEGDGFWIIDKPPLVPVHAMVDNRLENVVEQLKMHNQDEDYVTTTQRIDINTSGLMVVATKPSFAAYFAQLLRRKTKQIKKQEHRNDNHQVKSAAVSSNDLCCSKDALNIQKEYKCLVCIQEQDVTNHPNRSSSIVDSWQMLKDLQGSIVRHYLESSDRAPKRFEKLPPTNETSTSKWSECLLKIRHVSPLIPIPNPNSSLAHALWAQQKTTSVPPNVKAVCEVEIQLLTGRTHQIRGQLSKLGFPIVGDEQYGGAIPKDCSDPTDTKTFADQDVQLLALQCCHIGFWEADYEVVWNRKRRRDIMQGFPSDRWVSASLESAWWTPYVKLSTSGDDVGTTSNEDLELLRKQKQHQSTQQTSNLASTAGKPRRVDLLPPTVQLSPGKNKYILIKAVDDDDDGRVYWFVKSASPTECGGPYHANVAQDTLEWIEAAGFTNIQVTGGGRIDYDDEDKRAHVYGFSYGFGKGDHFHVSKLIEQFSASPDGGQCSIRATYDDSKALY